MRDRYRMRTTAAARGSARCCKNSGCCSTPCWAPACWRARCWRAGTAICAGRSPSGSAGNMPCGPRPGPRNRHAAKKSDFLAIASHEIRTPLHAVAGMLELGLQQAAAGQDVQDPPEGGAWGGAGAAGSGSRHPGPGQNGSRQTGAIAAAGQSACARRVGGAALPQHGARQGLALRFEADPDGGTRTSWWMPCASGRFFPTCSVTR